MVVNPWTMVGSVFAAYLGFLMYDGHRRTSALKTNATQMNEELPNYWSPLSPEEREAELLADCEKQEAVYRQELEAAPESWKIQAKLGASLLETNASRFSPPPGRLEEGRALVEKAYEAKPDNWRTMIARVALLLAELDNVKAEEAAKLAEAAVQNRMNRYTNLAMAKAFLVDGCALLCFHRRSFHRLKLDPEGSVYPQGKEPKELMQAYMQAAHKRLVEAGKRFHAAFDAELFERDNTTYGANVAPEVSTAKLMPLLIPYVGLLQLEKVQGGIHPNTMFAVGGCDVFVNRRLNGKTCPPEEPLPKKKKKKRKPTGPGDGTASKDGT